MSAKVWMYPCAINFSNVASDSPSMFMASRLTKSENDLIRLALHLLFVQYRVSTSFIWRISVFPPQAGQYSGTGAFPLPVRFSAICGMIMFAL